MQDVDGKPVELDDLLDGPVAIPLVRHCGCMPCRDFLMQLDGLRTELDGVGVGVVGVGGAADYQARHLMANGVGFPLLLGPEHQLYEALDVRRIPWWTLLSPVTWWKCLRARARVVRHARRTIVRILDDWPTADSLLAAYGRIPRIT